MFSLSAITTFLTRFKSTLAYRSFYFTLPLLKSNLGSLLYTESFSLLMILSASHSGLLQKTTFLTITRESGSEMAIYCYCYSL